jgi:hypothetical protein
MIGRFAPRKHRAEANWKFVPKNATDGCHLAQTSVPHSQKADRFWRILLQKSFWGAERKFLEPLMRLAPRDVSGS